MSDPRNVAHDKKVTQEKHHRNTKTPLAPQPASRGKKRAAGEADKEPDKNAPTQEARKVEQGPNDLEKSMAILSKLKEMEFHSRGNIETLAQLTLTIEEELKQGEFSEPIGALYSAQDTFHLKVAAFIETYEAKCEELKSAGEKGNWRVKTVDREKHWAQSQGSEQTFRTCGLQFPRSLSVLWRVGMTIDAGNRH